MGNRGSVRALSTVLVELGGQQREFVVSGGCDRHVRLFDPECELQKVSEAGHQYVKQKVNSILVAPPSN